MHKPIGILLFAAVFAAAASAQSPARPAKAGDVHVYSGELRTDRVRYEETVTVTAADGGQLRTRHVRTDRPEPTEGLYGADWSVLKSGFSGTEMQPAAKIMPQPLQVGSTWEGEFDTTNAKGDKSRMKTRVTVVAQEKVTTPAGAFDTYRIEHKGYLSGISWRGGFGVQQVLWYAPAIDRIVRGEYREQRTMGTETVYELKQFKPAD